MGRVLRGLARFIGNVMGASQPGSYPEAVRGVSVPEPEDPPAWTTFRPTSPGGAELITEEPSTGRTGTRQSPSKARRKKLD